MLLNHQKLPILVKKVRFYAELCAKTCTYIFLCVPLSAFCELLRKKRGADRCNGVLV